MGLHICFAPSAQHIHPQILAQVRLHGFDHGLLRISTFFGRLQTADESSNSWCSDTDIASDGETLLIRSIAGLWHLSRHVCRIRADVLDLMVHEDSILVLG